MTRKTIYTEVEVDVDISDFATEDLLEELENRGGMIHTLSRELLESIWLKRRMGQEYQVELDRLIYTALGKII